MDSSWHPALRPNSIPSRQHSDVDSTNQDLLRASEQSDRQDAASLQEVLKPEIDMGFGSQDHRLSSEEVCSASGGEVASVESLANERSSPQRLHPASIDGQDSTQGHGEEARAQASPNEPQDSRVTSQIIASDAGIAASASDPQRGDGAGIAIGTAFAAESSTRSDHTSFDHSHPQSFPNVTNPQSFHGGVQPLLPQTQAEAIMESENRHATELFQKPASSLPNDIWDDEDASFEKEIMGTEVPPLSEQQYTLDGTTPLVDSGSLSQDRAALESSPFSFDVNEDADFEDDDAFFAKLGTDGDSETRTEAVSNHQEDQIGSIAAAKDHVNGLSNAKSSSSVEKAYDSRAISSAPMTGDRPSSLKDQASAQAQDLSDLWKAALGDDELSDDGDAIWSPTDQARDGTARFEADNANRSLPALTNNGIHGVASRSSTDRALQSNGTTQHSYGGQNTTNRYKPTQPAGRSQNGSFGGASPIIETTPHQNRPSPSLNNHAAQGPSSQTFADILGPARPILRDSGKSFVDKSREGYKSPYDLPMDISRSRKRAAPALVRSNTATPVEEGRPPPPRRDSIASSARTIPQADMAKLPSYLADRPSTAVPAQSSHASGFFEELPASKIRPSSSASRPSVPFTQPSPAPKSSFVPPPTQTQTAAPLNHATSNSFQNQLVSPQKLSPYEGITPHQSTRQAVPGVNPRYSPAPGQVSSNVPPAARYSANATNVSRPQSTRTLPHQPRTSSPLTQRSTSAHQQPLSLNNSHVKTAAYPAGQHAQGQHLQLDEAAAPTDAEGSSLTRNSFAGSPPPLQAYDVASRAVPSYTGYSPQQAAVLGAPAIQDAVRNAPPRPQSQTSNARDLSSPITSEPSPPQRPQSAQYTRPHQTSSQSLPKQITDNQSRVEHAQNSDYFRPNDGRELDEFERWKGCPIFSFGFGGKAVKMFPQRVPRYIAGQKAPLMKCNPGEVKMENDHFSELHKSIATFPGPLKSKGKKKEVLDWLKKRLDAMESNEATDFDQHMISPSLDRRHDERILLWKILGVLVEHDGNLAGNPAAEKAVRAILSPLISEETQTDGPFGSHGAHSNIISKAKSNSATSSVESPLALEEIKNRLLSGERELAVWHAVDNKLWAHAMLISSTLSNEVRKQVTQEFVRQEVKTYGTNTESLSALYQIFAGNWEESVDELVPPSARAGLQMMSMTSNKGPAKNALDGLDKWRDTVALILSNRTTDDGKALIALGRLLASYGRTEASHVCYIFAQTPALFGAPDDPQVSIALLGADHVRRPYDYGRDFDSILLTEVYDFARTVLSSSSAATVSPHLQAYRLHHAMTLAEHGYRTEATKYCETIAATLKSTTKPSPYYHGLLVGSLQGLQDRLRQTPNESTGSWISKPSIDKVSGSIWAKFNSYVAGDEDDLSSARHTPHDPAAGPFAGIAGDSSPNPSISSADVAQSYEPSYGYSPNPIPASSPYAPVSNYMPRTSLDQQRPQHLAVSSSAQEHSRAFQPSQKTSSRPTTSAGLDAQQYASRPSYAPRALSYQPSVPTTGQAAGNLGSTDNSAYANINEDVTPYPALHPPDHHDITTDFAQQSVPKNFPQTSHVAEPSYGMSLQERTESHFTQPSGSAQGYLGQESAHQDDYMSLSYGHDQGREPPSSYEPPQSSYEPSISSYEPPTSSYEPPTSSYEPPTSSYQPPSSSYEPPSQSYEPPQDSRVAEPELATQPQRPKKSIMDLDDDDVDFEARAVALRKEERARKDREADEAFRKAAESDSQKDKAPNLNSKKSWFGGGWFGGKEKTADAGPPGGPIKVKLGEESSFYFDKELGKWVNKKGGTEEVVATTAAPPPKGPSRAVSAAAGPPARMMSTPPVPPIPAGVGSNGPPMRAVSGPTLSKPPGSSAPSRTSSPAKHTTEANDAGADLLQPPSAPPSRPSTSQGGTTDFDDLYGPAQARKGGTVRKSKKRAGYVDVMAK